MLSGGYACRRYAGYIEIKMVTGIVKVNGLEIHLRVRRLSQITRIGAGNGPDAGAETCSGGQDRVMVINNLFGRGVGLVEKSALNIDDDNRRFHKWASKKIPCRIAPMQFKTNAQTCGNRFRFLYSEGLRWVYFWNTFLNELLSSYPT